MTPMSPAGNVAGGPWQAQPRLRAPSNGSAATARRAINQIRYLVVALL